MIHFQQIMSGINVRPLLNQLDQHPELWGHDWTKDRPGTVMEELDNIVLRFNKSPVWNREPFFILTAAQPIIFDLMRVVPGVMLGRVIISRLRPNHRIDWHVDRMPRGIPLVYQRFQIPLDVHAGVRFCVGDETQHMEPGTIWAFDNSINHGVFNDSEHDRISMLCDIQPLHPNF